MFAVVVREVGDAAMIEGSWDIVRDTVAPQVHGAPGFVSALWMTDGGGETLNVLVFETEAAARRALDAARDALRPPFMRVASIDLYSVGATA